MRARRFPPVQTVKEFLGRARGVASLLRRDRSPARASLSESVARRAAQALAARLSGRLVDLVDLVSTRLLALDDVASELAAFVEDVRSRHGNDRVVAIIVRRNLLLDGTFLRLIEPILTGDTRSPIDPQAMDSGRKTLTAMLAELVALDEEYGPLPSVAEHTERLAWLADTALPTRCPRLWEWLQGCADHADDVRFLFGSYLVFLQTFTLRMGAHALLAGAATPALGHADAPAKPAPSRATLPKPDPDAPDR